MEAAGVAASRTAAQAPAAEAEVNLMKLMKVPLAAPAVRAGARESARPPERLPEAGRVAWEVHAVRTPQNRFRAPRSSLPHPVGVAGSDLWWPTQPGRSPADAQRAQPVTSPSQVRA